MKDPFIAIDNLTYDKADIITWLNKSNTSPNTRNEMYEYNMGQDVTIKKTIRFVQENNITKETNRVIVTLTK